MNDMCLSGISSVRIRLSTAARPRPRPPCTNNQMQHDHDHDHDDHHDHRRARENFDVGSIESCMLRYCIPIHIQLDAFNLSIYRIQSNNIQWTHTHHVTHTHGMDEMTHISCDTHMEWMRCHTHGMDEMTHTHGMDEMRYTSCDTHTWNG